MTGKPDMSRPPPGVAKQVGQGGGGADSALSSVLQMEVDRLNGKLQQTSQELSLVQAELLKHKCLAEEAMQERDQTVIELATTRGTLRVSTQDTRVTHQCHGIMRAI